MHRYNRKYGHDEIFKSYCGLESALPVLGELQHSLFVSRNHFDSKGTIGPPRKTGALVFPFFSWNALIPFKHQVPIGDPLIYDREIAKIRVEEIPTSNRLPLVMPKFDQELSRLERLSNYRRLIQAAVEKSSSPKVRVLLHPGDYELERELTRGQSVEISVINGSPLSAYEKLSHSMAQISKSRLIVSDYFGAHVFRATYLFDVPVQVINEAHTVVPWAPKIRELMLDFQAAEDDYKVRREIAGVLLGVGFKRGPTELRNLLYREQLPYPSRRAAVAVYKATRRLRVRFRESRYGGKGPIAAWYRRRIAQPIWESRLDRTCGPSSLNSLA